MKSKVIFAVLFLVFAANYSFGQTANDFEKKYGSAKYYEIRPYILVSPAFDKNGQLCRAKIIPSMQTLLKSKNIDSADFIEVPVSFSTVTYHSADKERLFPIAIFDSSILKEVFDELVPIKTRKGKAISSTAPVLGGAVYAVQLEFENITVHTNVVPQENAKIDARGFGENLDLFFNPPFGQISSARIVWTGRKCVEN
jgi:hypothetical protein